MLAIGSIVVLNNEITSLSHADIFAISSILLGACNIIEHKQKALRGYAGQIIRANICDEHKNNNRVL